MAWTNPAILSIVRWNRKPVSVLSRHLSSQPTPWQERAALSIPSEEGIMPVYMVLQALVPSPSYVAIWRREPLPHGFTLTLAGGLFSVTASIRLLPSVLSTAGYPFLSGLSSAGKPAATGHPTLFLFISELSLHGIIFSIQPFHFSAQGRSYVFAMLMALH